METAAELVEGAISLVFLVAALAGFVWPLLRLRTRAATATARPPAASQPASAAWAAYRGAARWSADPRFAFRAATAEIVRQAEFGPDGGHAVDEPASVHVHARNPHGRFFFVIARDDGTVFVKPISDAAAASVAGDQRQPD